MNHGNGTRLFLNEVATRDGLQMESRFIPTDDKVALIDRLSTLGYAKIEVTSFTSSRAIPALADGEAVMQRIARAQRVIYTAPVPSVRGAERALEVVERARARPDTTASHVQVQLSSPAI